MRTRATAILVLVSALVARPSVLRAQGAHSPSSVVTQVAELVESKYFDVAAAASMARHLRAAAAEGEFDSIDDPRDLAARLTSWLGRHDGHLRVMWRPPGPPGEARETPSPNRMSEDVRTSRWNFGFRRVEILPGNIGLIELSEFADLDAASNWDSESRRVADATLALVQRTDALIFDLRSNGGGGGMAYYLLSYFLPPDVVFSEMRARTAKREIRTLAQVGGHRRLEVPLYVLVSGQTGSAAESFAYSLQAMRRATIVGERSAGAANPGDFFDAGEGFTILVPMDTPVNSVTGTNWEGVGVHPDIAAKSERSLASAQIAALQEVLQIGLPAAEERDVRWALEALTSDQTAGRLSLEEFAGSYGNRVVRVERGELLIQRARWPARRLRPLDHDLFAVDGAPWRRVAFERQDDQVIALVELTSGGDETRWRKQ